MLTKHFSRFFIAMIALITVVALGPACNRAPEPTVVVTEGGTEGDVLADVRKGWVAAYNAGDASRMASYFAEDAELLIPGEPTLTGRDAIEVILVKWLSGPPRTLEIVKSDVRSAGDMAVDRAIRTVREGDSPDGAVRTGKYVMVWQRWSDGTWKIVWDIWNSNAPAK